MQQMAEPQNEEGVAENTETEASVSSEVNETTDYENDSDSDESVSHSEDLPEGVPYTSGFSNASGVASIVAPGEEDDESRVLYDNGDGTYSDDSGTKYSYQGDGNWTDENGNTCTE